MAVAAETYIAAHFDTLPLAGEGMPWISAETVPELSEARAIGLRTAQDILEQRSALLMAGEFEQVPYAVDPLTTAGRALTAENEYGADHPKSQEARRSLDVDSGRLLAEGARKLSWEYFEPLEQEYDQEQQSYAFHGRLLLEMVREGITPIAEPEESEYRLIENVEEVTYGAIRNLGRLAVDNVVILKPAQPITVQAPSPHVVNVLTISECADWAIDAYERGEKMQLGGYVPENRKLMLRGVSYGKTTDSRYQEQLGLPGEFITHEVVTEAMEVMNIVAEGARPTKQEVRSTQMINLNGQGVLDLARLLDEIASRKSGKRIFLGEEIPEGQPKDYDGVPAIAAARKQQLSAATRELSDFLIALERQGIDHWTANGLVEAKVKQLLFETVKADPEQTAIAFDEKTAAGVQEVIELRRNGAEAQARLRERQVFAEAPPPAFCGAGSCGLESVNLSGEEGEELAKELGVEDGDTVLHDTERACPNCKRTGGVYYAFNSKKVNKYCRNCKEFTSEGTK